MSVEHLPLLSDDQLQEVVCLQPTTPETRRLIEEAQALGGLQILQSEAYQHLWKRALARQVCLEDCQVDELLRSSKPEATGVLGDAARLDQLPRARLHEVLDVVG